MNSFNDDHLHRCACFRCETRGKPYTYDQFDDEYNKGTDKICKHCGRDAGSHGAGSRQDGHLSGKCKKYSDRPIEIKCEKEWDKNSWFEAK